MVNRMILGAFDGTYVLRVSRPGYNVLDTGLPKENLAFDSRWSGLTRIQASGIVRAYEFREDMIGTIVYGTLPISGLPSGTLPTVVCSFRPDANNACKVATWPGGLFAGGYIPSYGTLGVGVQYAYSYGAVDYTRIPVGWITYHLLRA